MSTRKKLANLLKSALLQRNLLPINYDSDGFIYFCRYTVNNQYTPIYASVGKSNYGILFLAVLPLDVPQAKQSKLIQMIHEINEEINIGSFEVDINFKEIYFRTSILFEREEEFSIQLISNTLNSCLIGLSRFSPQLISFLEQVFK